MAGSLTSLIEDTLAFFNCLLLYIACEDGGFYRANGFFFNKTKAASEFVLSEEQLCHRVLSPLPCYL